jgi:hypothetical protein
MPDLIPAEDGIFDRHPGHTSYWILAFTVMTLEAISKKFFGSNSLLGVRFPALRDDPSNFILSVGLKSSKYGSIPPV